ncbi:hypothetical protein [Streptomyces sp. NBC_01244]|uniref:hypothetical protein n=1 Tax=Streptomyces sp. NBC_01244 TaxID=2903797 RepID=UPI002E0FB2BB|nr:hypothetical protein OG247_32010 [Streptomyces sp. NBC_01244]
MTTTHRPPSHQSLPAWLREGARVTDAAKDREAIVPFIGSWEDPQTRRIVPCAVFLRPEDGGTEWIVAPGAVREAASR